MKERCSYQDCDKPRKYKELCSGHWQQKYRRGEELRPLKPKSKQHFWSEDGRGGMEKQCPRCLELKSDDQYSRDSHQPSGRKQYCKDCQHSGRPSRAK